MLWPDRAREAAANNLHQVLHAARRQLAGGDGGQFLRLDDDVLSLAGEELWVDADAFRREAVAALRAGTPSALAPRSSCTRGRSCPRICTRAGPSRCASELEGYRDELAELAGTGARVGRAPARSDNLPTELTTFIGRESELEELAALVRRSPLVTVVGTAGCGKTRLAVEAAARQAGQFRDGVWLVELAPLSQSGLIADAVAAAVGLRPGREARELEALVDSLATREALIVLDNCDHLVAACAHLAETLLRACPQLQMLATSREPLAVSGEVVWRLPPLTLPEPGRPDTPAELLRSESIRLFVDRAGAAQPGFALNARNAADVALICHSLDGVPLAIELAAASVGSLPPGEIGRRLGESFRLLRQERRTAEPRRQTLEGALDWSYRLLDADEAALLRRLAVFAGTFDLAAVESVCGNEDVVDVLGRLVRKSLVVAEEIQGESRYRLLEMIRQYARERLAEADETATLAEQHARWYGELPERAGPPGTESRLRLLDLEPDNLRAALGWLLAHDPAAALRLADSLGDWWMMRGRLVEGREWLEAAVERSSQATAADAWPSCARRASPGAREA